MCVHAANVTDVVREGIVISKIQVGSLCVKIIIIYECMFVVSIIFIKSVAFMY